MQSLIEREVGNAASPSSSSSSASRFPPSAASGSSNRSFHLLVGCIVFGVSVYLAIFLLPQFSETDLIPDGPPPSRNNNNNNKKKSSSSKQSSVDLSTDQDGNDEQPLATTSKKSSYSTNRKNKKKSSSSSSSSSLAVEPWGYNKNRNVPRWKAIRESIKKDMIAKRDDSRFVLVDYGSDQGFFSISAAHEFAKDGIFVVSVEMGGVGGEIWKKGVSEGTNDVLSIQEKMVAKYVDNQQQQHEKDEEEKKSSSFMICQTKISPKMFYDLHKHRQVHRYQFVLSVFHWFDLPTRKDFESALVTLFKNAKSTFIELPTIGDRSSLIRKQVGWSNFEKWYDGRSDIKKIILDAAKNENFPVRVEMIVSVPWLKWTRDMYRVDWVENDEDSSSSKKENFDCKLRRKEIYHCNEKRQKLQECI